MPAAYWGIDAQMVEIMHDAWVNLNDTRPFGLILVVGAAAAVCAMLWRFLVRAVF